MLESLTQNLKGILLGDKGYLSKAKADILSSRGLSILTSSRRNAKTKSIQTEEEKQWLSRRGLIEMVNMMVAVVAHCLNPNKSTFRNLLQK